MTLRFRQFSSLPAPAARWLLVASLALLLALHGLGGALVAPVAAQADEDEARAGQAFDRLIRSTQRNRVLHGPESGELELSEDGAFLPTGVEAENFLLHVSFGNPYAALESQWDYGIFFRNQSTDAYLAFIIVSDGSWGFISSETDGLLASGLLETIRPGQGAVNVVDLYVQGDQAQLGINGDYVATIELDVEGAGAIALTSGLLDGSFVEGASTPYTDLLIWDVPDPATQEDAADDDADQDDTDDEDANQDGADDEDTEPSDEDSDTPDDEDTSDDVTDKDADQDTDTDDDDADEGDEDTETYTSPTFGYSLSYGDPWELAEETSEEQVDRLRLIQDRQLLQFLGAASELTPAECIDQNIEEFETNAAPDVLEVATDEEGRELQADGDDRAWVVLFATVPNAEGDLEDLTIYADCRTIEEGESLLLITHVARSDEYNDAIADRREVLDTLEIDGGDADDSTPESDETPEADDEPEPDADQTPEADDSTPEADDLPEGAIAVFLAPVGGSGVSALGTIEPVSDDTVRVTLLALLSSGTGVVTIHEGSCADPEVEPAFEVGALDEAGALDGEVDVSVDELTSGDYVLIISTDGTAETAISCGELSAA